jgi:hypothetical protein
MEEKQYLKLGLLPWMPKNIKALKEQGFWTTQESIDEAFQKAIWKTIERWEDLAKIRDAEMWGWKSEEWMEEKAHRMRDLEIDVRDIKEKSASGIDSLDPRMEKHWVMIHHTKHMYMSYQEWIDFCMKHWTDFRVGERKGNFYGFTEERMKRYYPKERFDAEKMKPCTCKMCTPQWYGKTYYF